MLIMMQAREVNRQYASADVVVSDGGKPRPYWLFVTGAYVTVIAGDPDRRKLGRTFHSRADLAAHYKRDGQTLLDVVSQLDAQREAAA